MRNLENVLDLQEMNLQEMKDVNGGFLSMLAGAYVAYAVYCALESPVEVWEGFKNSLY